MTTQPHRQSPVTRPDTGQPTGAVSAADEEARRVAPGLPGLTHPVQQHRLRRDRFHPRVSAQGHQHAAFQPRLITPHARPYGRTTTSPASSAGPGSSAQTVTASTPPAVHALAHRRGRRTRPQRRPTAAPDPPRPLRHRHPRDPTAERRPVAQLSWQEPTDGSDTPAMARIRWQRTTAHARKPSATACLLADSRSDDRFCLPLVILQSARFRRFCHPQLHPATDYTPGRQGDPGRTATAWSSVRDRDGRPRLPAGAETRDATFRLTRSADCACRMARSIT